MEAEWELDRFQLCQLRGAHPDWTLTQLAMVLGRSLSWVRKWLKFFREAGQPSPEMFKSRSRVPQQRPFQIVPLVRDAILSLRDELKARYVRVVGAKPILYHLHRDWAFAFNCPALWEEVVSLSSFTSLPTLHPSILLLVLSFSRAVNISHHFPL